MKKTLLAAVLAVGLMVGGMVGTASATPYSSYVDFSGSGTFDGHSYKEISDSNGAGYVGNFAHVVTFDPAAASIETALLTLTYAKISGGEGELWKLDSSGGTLIGTIGANPNDDHWRTQTFDVSSFISGFSGTSWTLGFKFNETTSGTDKFYLDESTLAGKYTEVAPVPEPGTMMLLGIGLGGLAIFGKRRMNKEA